VGEALTRLLVDAARHPGEPVDRRLVAALDPGQRRRLAEAAASQLLMPAVWLAVQPHADLLPEPTVTALRSGYRIAALHHLKMLALVQRTGAALDAAGVPWLVVKGPVLAELVHPRSDLREYHDVDLLVPADRFEDAVDTLAATGAEQVERNWELMTAEMRGELNLATPGGLVDLHWHLLHDAAERQGVTWRHDRLFERSVAVELGGFPARTLDPVDTALHLCVHACLGGAHRLGWLVDVTAALQRPGCTLEELAWRARQAGLPLHVAVVLAAVGRTLEVPGALDTARALGRGHAWVAAVDLARRAWPPERRWSGRLSMHLLPGATRGSTASSLRSLGPAVWRAVAELTEPASPWRGGRLELRRRPAMLDAPADETVWRARYFDAVRSRGC
jgi:aromatic ring-cleaving dioxygenase